ncbi:helix-turn-helix domain-containing protein [Enterococcus casseliflavus]|uniref:helix-turn-helix domain-containing protein n=1 Tax=Enterococcus casseliflavus TaxID=37734 RepID=UPI0039A66AD1
MEINEVLKKRRKELSMTQEQVAEKIFVSQKSVSNCENNKNYPDIESLIRLAHLYDLSLDHLLLEGSDIVKDIKEQAELSIMKKLSLPPLITNISLVILLLSQKWWGDLSEQAVIIVTISIFSNFVSMFYFKKRVGILQKKVGRSWIFIPFLVLVVVLAISLILFIPSLFTK